MNLTTPGAHGTMLAYLDEGHLLPEVVTLKGLVGIGILDDPKQVPCFERLPAIQAVGDIPLQINCRQGPFLACLDQERLPRNVMSAPILREGYAPCRSCRSRNTGRASIGCAK
jgi:hypothetical protein